MDSLSLDLVLYMDAVAAWFQSTQRFQFPPEFAFSYLVFFAAPFSKYGECIFRNKCMFFFSLRLFHWIIVSLITKIRPKEIQASNKMFAHWRMRLPKGVMSVGKCCSINHRGIFQSLRFDFLSAQSRSSSSNGFNSFFICLLQ